MQPEQTGRKRSLLVQCLLKCIHNGRVPTTVARNNHPETPTRIDQYLSETFVLQTQFIRCVLKPPRAEVAVQLDLHWPSPIINALSGKVWSVERHSRQITSSVINLGAGVGHQRVEIRRPYEATQLCVHQCGEC